MLTKVPKISPRDLKIHILFDAKVLSQVSQKIRSIDPEGAVALIEAINRIYGLKVDTKELLEKAEEIKRKPKELADQHRKLRKAEEKRGAPDAMYV